MLSCSFEPGLFILKGLEPHETAKAFSVVRSLIVHKKMMDQHFVQIPMTKDYLEKIYDALENIPIKNPPLESELKQYIFAALAKMCLPLIPSAKLNNTTFEQDIVSEWIDEFTREIWLDSLTAAMFDEYTDEDIYLSIATWFRNELPAVLPVSNSELCENLGVDEYIWNLPILSTEFDWRVIYCTLDGWPSGIDAILIDEYARRYLRISPNELEFRRRIEFSDSCFRNILHETDKNIRNLLVEVIACRAYNRIRPEQGDETIIGQPGVRRLYVKKMAPPVRLHYKMDDNKILFTLYSNGDHDSGL